MKFNSNADAYMVPFYNQEQMLIDAGIEIEEASIMMECRIINCLGQKIVKVDRDKHYWEDGTWTWNGTIYTRWNEDKQVHEQRTVKSLGCYTVCKQV